MNKFCFNQRSGRVHAACLCPQHDGDGANDDDACGGARGTQNQRTRADSTERHRVWVGHLADRGRGADPPAGSQGTVRTVAGSGQVG